MDTSVISVNTAVNDNGGKLTAWTKISYGLGDLASQMSWTLATSFLMYFYTDVYGLSAGFIATLLLVARGWDAILDPVIGLVMERTNSKYGRFRPYILFGAPFLALFNILTFHVPSFDGTGKIIYAFVVYIILNTAYSLVNVPYGALATVMTQDANDRTSLGSSRMFFTTIATIIIGGATMPLLQKLGGGNMADGFLYTAMLYSLASLPLFYLVFRQCKEVICPAHSERPSLKESLKCVSYNRPLAMILATLFLVFLSLFGRLAVLIYYYIYVLGRPDLIAMLMMIFGIANAAGTLLVNLISEKMEKRSISWISSILSGLGILIIYFTGYTDISTVIIGTVMWGLFAGFGSPMTFSMLADTIEFAEWKTGRRADGAIYATLSLATKVAITVVGSLSMLALDYIGYIPNVPQSVQAIEGLNLLANLLPAIFLFLAAIPMFFYGITKERYKVIINEINDRRTAKVQ